MSRVLAVPVVAHELRAQESYLQTIDALDNLNKGKSNEQIDLQHGFAHGRMP